MLNKLPGLAIYKVAPMSIRLPIALLLVIAGLVCSLIGAVQMMTLNEDVNARLPQEKRIDPIWWGPLNSWKMDRMRMEMFPERWKRNWIVSLSGMACLLLAWALLVFGD
jgi:hypothetical protein